MIKRFFDIVVAIIGLIVLSPLIIFFAVLIKREDGGPVFYRGDRVGLNGKMFKICKFRSMVVDAEAKGASSTSRGDVRITRIGGYMRKWKLDEVPQLINVILGEMSFVGPRPQVKWAVDLYSPKEREILTIKPGITDYASLFFSNEEDILSGSNDPDKDYMEKIHPRKIELSMEYVKNRNLSLDIKIIMLTLLKIIQKHT